MTKKISKSTKNSLKNLKEVLQPFGALWEEWNSSGNSVINARQYEIIQSYRKHKSHRVFAKKTQATSRNVCTNYMKAVRKLKLGSTMSNFDKWRVHQLLTEAGVAKQEIDYKSLVETVTDIRIPASVFIKMFEASVPKNKGKNEVHLDKSDLKQISHMNEMSFTATQDMTKQFLRAVIYISI